MQKGSKSEAAGRAYRIVLQRSRPRRGEKEGSKGLPGQNFSKCLLSLLPRHGVHRVFFMIVPTARNEAFHFGLHSEEHICIQVLMKSLIFETLCIHIHDRRWGTIFILMSWHRSQYSYSRVPEGWSIHVYS